ncbi:PilZ domain-containing protein [Aquamicrobium segne]|uniref:PilZ domain-containing protein n=1 Tax=Aquamicrobium segne TaxID=469547 RepID=A0ABW0GXG8_9HYPH
MNSEINLQTPPQSKKRSFQSVQIKIYGRFMLEDRSEYSCQVLEMSSENIALRAERNGKPGEKVIAYIDHIGRIEGVVERIFQNGFAMKILASKRKRAKLASQLTWLVNRHELGLTEERRHERTVPHNPASVLHLTDGRQYPCRIIDLSLSGAAIEIQVKPALGVQVSLGTMRGEIVRHFEEGVAIEFSDIQRPEALDAEFNS